MTNQSMITKADTVAVQIHGTELYAQITKKEALYLLNNHADTLDINMFEGDAYIENIQ